MRQVSIRTSYLLFLSYQSWELSIFICFRFHFKIKLHDQAIFFHLHSYLVFFVTGGHKQLQIILTGRVFSTNQQPILTNFSQHSQHPGSIQQLDQKYNQVHLEQFSQQVQAFSVKQRNQDIVYGAFLQSNNSAFYIHSHSFTDQEYQWQISCIYYNQTDQGGFIYNLQIKSFLQEDFQQLQLSIHINVSGGASITNQFIQWYNHLHLDQSFMPFFNNTKILFNLQSSHCFLEVFFCHKYLQSISFLFSGSLYFNQLTQSIFKTTQPFTINNTQLYNQLQVSHSVQEVQLQTISCLYYNQIHFFRRVFNKHISMIQEDFYKSGSLFQ